MNINITQHTYRLTDYQGGTDVSLGPMPDGYKIEGGSVGGQQLFCNRITAATFNTRAGEIIFSAKLPRNTPAVTVVVRFKPKAAKAA